MAEQLELFDGDEYKVDMVPTDDVVEEYADEDDYHELEGQMTLPFDIDDDDVESYVPADYIPEGEDNASAEVPVEVYEATGAFTEFDEEEEYEPTQAEIDAAVPVATQPAQSAPAQKPSREGKLFIPNIAPDYIKEMQYGVKIGVACGLVKGKNIGHIYLNGDDAKGVVDDEKHPGKKMFYLDPNKMYNMDVVIPAEDKDTLKNIRKELGPRANPAFEGFRIGIKGAEVYKQYKIGREGQRMYAAEQRQAKADALKDRMVADKGAEAELEAE